MQLAGPEDGGLVYTERGLEVQNGNSGQINMIGVEMNPVHAVTGSDAVVLTQAVPSKNCDIPNPKQQEFRLTLTIQWEESLAAGQRSGTLWLAYNLAKNTSALAAVGVEVPIVTPGGSPQTFEVVTTGEVGLRYHGVAKAHIWLSYFAEFA